MPRPVESYSGKTPPAQLILTWQRLYYDAGHGTYFPTVVCRKLCKSLVETYGLIIAELAIEKFFWLISIGHPNFRSAPITVRCAYFNRNELIRLVKEELRKGAEEPAEKSEEGEF